MARRRRRVLAVLLAGVPVLAVYAAGGTTDLPLKVVVWLAVWAALSLPVGIAVGHCVLSEK
jgi:hypothetical protein